MKLKLQARPKSKLNEESPAKPAAPATPGTSQAPSAPEPLYSPSMVTPLPPAERGAQQKKPGLFSSPPRKPGLTEFQRSAFRIFGPTFTRKATSPKLAESLRKSRAGVRPEAVLSAGLLGGMIGGAVAGVASMFLLLVLVPLMGIELPLPLFMLFGMMPAIAGLMGFVLITSGPGTRAKARGKDIDNRLPYALNYIAAMASAGVTVDQIFRSLGEQRIYGECAKEAEAIYRDISLFGRDTVTAFKRAIERTPSQKFAEVLQGAITTFGSGGDLQGYFSSKAQRYMVENHQTQKQFVETMGLMAETYVTTAVAGPLFLMVMMAIMGLLSGGGPGQLTMIVYLMLPTANFGFVYGLYAMTPKV